MIPPNHPFHHPFWGCSPYFWKQGKRGVFVAPLGSLQPYNGWEPFFAGQEKSSTVRSSYYPTKNGKLFPPKKNNNTKTWEKKRGTFINDKHHSLPPYLQTSPKKTGNLLLRGQVDHFPCFFLGGEGGTHHLVCRKFQHPSMTSTSNSQNSRRKQHRTAKGMM